MTISRHDPDGLRAPLAYRDRSVLPFDSRALSPSLPLMLDTTCYIDALHTGGLPSAIQALLVDRSVLHSAVARAELAVTIGILDPRHPGTANNLRVIRETLERMAPSSIVSPSPQAWADAAVATGILARLLGIAKDARRALLNDALLFESAREARAVLVSRNIRHLDLLLQLDPTVQVLLYDRSP
jgi:hypothetical protein